MKKSYGKCAESEYVGVSKRQFYCGDYNHVLKKGCTGSRDGFVMIRRKQLDYGEVSKNYVFFKKRVFLNGFFG